MRNPMVPLVLMLIAVMVLIISLQIAGAQTFPVLTVHPQHLGLPTGAAIEAHVELDADPTTQEFILANYDATPVRRAVMQLQSDRTVCVGPWAWWFEGTDYAWPTYITLDGVTRVFHTTDRGDWAIQGLELPACGQ